MEQMSRGDALELLGLDYDASTDDIKKRFRKLAFEHHPDRGGDIHTFMKIRHAYLRLSKCDFVSGKNIDPSTEDLILNDLMNFVMPKRARHG